jgi:phosphopantetheinyl transferase (holo-ACP synthase)
MSNEEKPGGDNEALFAEAAKATNKEERVRFIAQVMSENRWPMWPHTRAFRCKLAEVWGLAEATVRAYSAEAHRVVALDPEEREQLREKLAARMEGLAQKAENSVSAVTGLADLNNAIKALEAYAKFAGIELETKVKVSGSVNLEDVADLQKRLKEADEDT